MVKEGSCFKNALQKVGLFPHNHFLRYNGEAEYQTATGGLFSITTILVCIVLFFNMGLKTLKKELITYSSETVLEADPAPTILHMGVDSMTTIVINGVNLSAVPRLFDVSMVQQFYTFGHQLLNESNILL